MQALSLKNRVADLLPIVKKNGTAQSIVTYLAERARHRTDTDLKRLKYDMYHAGFFLDEREYEAFWEELSKTGQVGTLIRATTVEEPVKTSSGKQAKKDGKAIVKKIPKPPKFHWTFSCKQFGLEAVALMGIKGVASKQNVSLERLESSAEKIGALATSSAENETVISMRLSRGKAKLYVPNDLSKKDAKVISKKLNELAK